MAQRASSATRVQPGGHTLSREFIASHQRARIINALAEESLANGYRAVTVADIVKRAGIARNTFYDNFSSKEDCFLAAFDFVVEEVMSRVLAAAETAGESWSLRVRAGLEAFLGYVADEPALARTCIVEALSAGAPAVARYESAIQSFVPLLRHGRKVSPMGSELPETLEDSIVGGLFWIVYQRIVTGRSDGIEDLLPELVEFALTPYLGAPAAREIALEKSADVEG